MSKLYRTSGTGNAQQTLDVNDEKIKIYADETSLDADLANIGENEIVATNEPDFFSSFAGMVVAFAGANAPRGWLLCDGSAISRSLYSALFSVIGTTYGAGDGSTTFNLPDYRECVLVGTGTNDTDTISTHDTYTLGQFKDDQIQNITGSLNAGAPGSGTQDDTGAFQKTTPNTEWYSGGSATKAAVHTFDASLVARTGTTTHGKQKGVNYIIKY